MAKLRILKRLASAMANSRLQKPATVESYSDFMGGGALTGMILYTLHTNMDEKDSEVL
jgi:hypothetical protein